MSIVQITFNQTTDHFNAAKKPFWFLSLLVFKHLGILRKQEEYFLG